MANVKNTAKSIEEVLEGGASTSEMPIHPGRLGKEVCEFLSKDAHLVVDGGDINAHVTPLFKATLMYSQAMFSGIRNGIEKTNPAWIRLAMIMILRRS